MGTLVVLEGLPGFGMIEIFFQSQQQWGRSKTPIDSLKKVARFGGITGADVDLCISNENLLKYIQETAEKGQKQFQINSTPSFIINGKIKGSITRVPKKRSILSNMSKGAIAKKSKLTKKPIKISLQVANLLKQNNIYFAGIDFIQEKLIGDINVTSPTGLATYYRLTGVNLSKYFWDNI